MQPLNTEQMIITDARRMPIVKAYAKKIGLVDTIGRLADTQMDLSPGMVLYTLSGRSPGFSKMGRDKPKSGCTHSSPST